MTVVNKIILVNIIVFLVCNLFIYYGLHLENLLALYPIDSEFFSPFQLITHLFVHVEWNHLFFNMLFFYVVANEVESIFKNKFLSFYLLSGLFSSGLYFLGTGGPIIGASGAVFATITVSILSTMKLKNFQYKFIENFSLNFRNLFFSFGIIYELYLSLFGETDDVAHWAHIFGVIFGVIYFFNIKKTISN